MRTWIICIALTFLSFSMSEVLQSSDQKFQQKIDPTATWPLFTDNSYIYLLGLFHKQRVSIYKHSFTVAEPAMFKAAIILSQKLNITANGKQFAYRVEDTSGRDVIQTLQCTCQAIEQNQILGIVGPEHSGDAKTVSRLANHVGLPVIGYSTTNPELSNRNLYRTFYRLPPSDATTADALLRLFQKYKWNSTNIIYQSDDYGESGLKALKEAFNQAINISRQIEYDLLTDEMDDLKSQLEKSPSRIVIVWANTNATTKIIQKALEAKKILAPVFLWILIASDATKYITDVQHVDQLLGMFQLRLVTPNKFGVPVNTTLLDKALAIWKEYEPESYPHDKKKIDIFALYAFDAAWALILSIEKLCQQNRINCLEYLKRSSCFSSELVNHNELNEIMQTMNFTGISGYVEFQSDTTDRVGNTVAHYIIDNLQRSKTDNKTLELVEVLKLNGNTVDENLNSKSHWMESTSNILWPSGSSEPPKSYKRLEGKLVRFRVICIILYLFLFIRYNS